MNRRRLMVGWHWFVGYVSKANLPLSSSSSCCSSSSLSIRRSAVSLPENFPVKTLCFPPPAVWWMTCRKTELRVSVREALPHQPLAPPSQSRRLSPLPYTTQQQPPSSFHPHHTTPQSLPRHSIRGPHFVRETDEPTPHTPAGDDTEEHGRARRSQDTRLQTRRAKMLV